MWGAEKEKLLPLPLPFCPQCSWLEVAKQAKVIRDHTKMVVAAVHHHTLRARVPQQQ